MSLVWKNIYFEGEGSLLTSCIRGCCCVCCLKVPESHILSQLNGEINLRELTALMGPSGAGKSTLLKCITQGENYTGFKGELLTDVATVRSSFITQVETDHLLHNLKVSESVWYASEMKNPTISRAERWEIVDNLLRDMKLGASRDNLVEQCSGGEKKRIAIALELTSSPKPNFLFLDEPLSGLDSSAGKQMVIMLRELAISHEMAIVATIHQPSLEIFRCFHKAYVVSKEGKCIFSGPPDSLRNHLRTNHYAITDECNPADAIIEIGAAVERHRTEEINNDSKLCWCWARNGQEDTDIERGLIEDTDTNKTICEQMSRDLSLELLNRNNIRRAHHRSIQVDGLCKNSANFSFWKLWVLFKRSCWTSLFRQRKLIFIRCMLHSVVAAVLAGLYNREMGLEDGCYATNSTFDPKNCSCVESVEEMRNESVSSQNVKFHFFSLLFLMFAALMPTVLTFPAEIKLFLNEHRNGWYNTISYYISKTIIEIPFQLLFPYFYTYFLYWFSQQLGMHEWYGGFFGYMNWRYSYFLGITLLSCFIAQGLGFLIGIICVNSFNITVVLSSSVLLFLFLFSGFFVKTMQMGTQVQWITYLSFIRFSFESLLIIIYGFERCEFMTDDATGQKVPAASAILYIFNLKDEDLRINFYWLIGHLITTRVFAFIVLKHFADPKFLRPKSFIPDCVQFAINEASALSLCCKKLTRWFVYVLKFIAVLFLIQLALGVVVIGIKAAGGNK